MKIRFYAILLFALAPYYTVQAQVAKEKKVSGYFKVESGDKLLIDNRYGKVDIHTWDKNEMTVEITISVKAKNEEKAQKMLDRISIEENTRVKETHKVSYRTVLEGSNSWSLGNDKSEMEINYLVYTPKKNAIDIENEFGDVMLEDFDGDMQMTVKYGSFKAQKLSGANKIVKVSFGKATIASIETGYVEVSYTNLTIEKAQNIEVVNKFGESDIKTAQTLKINQRYGDLDIGTVEVMTGSIEFSNMDINTVSKSLDFTMKYCGKATIKSIAAGAEKVRLNASFSNLYCHLEKESNLNIDGEVEFGDIKNKSDVFITETKGSDNFTKNFTGKTGKGSGSMVLRFSYGDVVFN